jgi:hypothetical protein
MEFTRQNAPISDKKFTSLERMRTNVPEKARERGLEIEGKINNHFDELPKKEKRRIVGKEVKSAARQFRKRRKQTEADAKGEIRDAKKWKSDIAKEEKRRRKEVTDWKTEAQKWKKETQRLRRNARARERRVEEKRRIAEGKWRGKKKFVKLQLKVGDKLSKILEKPREILKPILARHAIKKKVKKYVITPNGNYDPSYFLTITEDEVKTLINSETEPRNVRMSLACEMVRSDPKTGEEVSTVAHFGSNNHKPIGMDDTEETQGIMREKILKSFSEYQRRGSGWRLRRVTRLEIHIGEFRPLRGMKHEPLHKSIASKKAIINMKNDDDECFKGAVTRALNPTDIHPERITKELKGQSEELDWEGTEFPTPVDGIKRFEKNNNININVFSADEKLKVYPLRVSGKSNPIRLFLWKNHYSVVKDMSRLVGSQISNNEHKKYICDRCLNSFGSDELLEKHLELCSNNDYQRHEYRKPGSTTKFENYEKIQEFPIVIYADFECYINRLDEEEKSPDRSSTTLYQKHNPSGFCYYIKFFDNSIYKPKLVHYTQQYEGEDITKKFVDLLEEETLDIHKRFKTPAPNNMTPEGIEDYCMSTQCYACGEEFTEEDYKVSDHCHYTGEYRGAAHNSCNLRMRQPKFIPVLFHNLEGYDAHLFIRNLGVSSGDIGCIPKTEEKYISFTKEVVVDTFENKDGKEKEIKRKLRFLDSFKFMASSLDKLAKGLGKDDFENLDLMTSHYTTEQREILKQKGVYPYEYMNEFDRLEETSLPPRSKLFSSLTNGDISDTDYKRAQNVWNTFGMKTMRDYHDLYLKTDVLLLADIMENFRKVCRENYGLDPMWYYTAPGLAWDACLKLTEVELDLISDPDMYLLIERGIRGGISTITKRHATANNKYMANYDPKKESKYLPYLDANNLYGWAMSQPLPIKNFEWMDDNELEKWMEHSCILEVDFEYPDDLHDLHDEYPLAPERITVNKTVKLIPNLNGREKYVLHHTNLKQYLDLGLKLVKIHRGVKFLERDWMKEYIQLNTDLRTKGTTDFEKDFFKLMNNYVFGKTMENVRNRVDIRIVNNEKKWNKLAKKHNFKSVTIFSENLVAVHMRRTSVKLRKPIYLGMSILDISKTLMYDLHYNYIKPMYGNDAELLFTDTDSLCYEITTGDFLKDISEDVHERFDTSNVDKDNPSGIPTGINRKVIGMMKSETGEKQIEQFVGLRAKLYAYKMAEDGKEEKKCKGVKKTTIKNEITFDNYKECLFSGERQWRGMNVFRSRLHEIYTERIVKVALSASDDKRIICEDGIHTLAIEHKDLRQ